MNEVEVIFGRAPICLKAAGFDPVKDEAKKVICSVCGGKGKLWIGSPTTDIEIHQTETKAILSDQLNEQVNQLQYFSVSNINKDQFSALIERLDKIIDLQQQALQKAQ